MNHEDYLRLWQISQKNNETNRSLYGPFRNISEAVGISNQNQSGDGSAGSGGGDPNFTLQSPIMKDFLHFLPTPRIGWTNSPVNIVSVNTDGTAGRELNIQKGPTIKVNGFSDEFLEKYDVRVEMVHWRKSNIIKFQEPVTNEFKIKSKGLSFVTESDFSPNVWRMPWPENFWTRAKHTPAILKDVELKTERPNCYLAERNGQTIPVWEYLNGRYMGDEVAFVFENDLGDIQSGLMTCFSPIVNMRRGGSLERTLRKPYTPNYCNYYIAFRYIVWDPDSNNKKGQIYHGPLSQVIKVSNVIFPFHVNPDVIHENGAVSKPVPDDFDASKFKCSIQTNKR